MAKTTLTFKVHNAGPELEQGVRAVMLTPVLFDPATAEFLGVPTGTPEDGTKILFQHVNHEEQDLFVKGRLVKITVELGDLPAAAPVVKKKKAGETPIAKG